MSSDEVLRDTTTACPHCLKEIPGQVVLSGGKVWLTRTCPEHGEYRFLLSNHGPEYADLDAFFYDVLGGRFKNGQITNYWVLLTSLCQQRCPYCSVNVENPFYSEVTPEEFSRMLDRFGGAKLTLAGGEPTRHPKILEFIRTARARGVQTVLATNGIDLVSPEYCLQLKEAGVEEVRISFEHWESDTPDPTGTSRHRKEKRAAVENCLAAGIPVVLSPTIAKGQNEHVLLEALAYAADKPLVREVSVNGFSWTGSALHMDPGLMIMTDELADIVHRGCGAGRPRGDLFVWAKAIFTLLDLLDIRLCLYTQVLVMVREKGGLRNLTEYLSMPRMQAGLNLWRRLRFGPRRLRLALFLACMAPSLSLRAAPLLFSLASLLLANVSRFRGKAHARRLLSVVLNTNCSPLSDDHDVSPRCNSGNLFVADGTLTESVSTLSLRAQAKRTKAAGARQRPDA